MIKRGKQGGLLLEKKGILSLGEAFIDYISKDTTNTDYQEMLGGATVNLAVWTSRLGLPTYYLCKLGSDSKSAFVVEEFKRESVNLDYSIHSKTKKLCGVYINLTESGDRVFHSYINPTPNDVLSKEELSKEAFEKTRIFYFGSGTLFQHNAKLTTERALNYAHECHNLIAFDANLRLKRWKSEKDCRDTVLEFLKHAQIVKLAEEELSFLTQTQTLEAGLEKLSNMHIPYAFITMGSKGAYGVKDGHRVFAEAPRVKAIDPTGAGDAFMAGILYGFHELGMPEGKIDLMTILQFANHLGAQATTQIGSIGTVPLLPF